MKKGQMELIGIAIVVILMSLGILFMLSFGISKKGPTFKQEFTNKELVSNTLSTMLRVKAHGCGDLTIEDLMQDCSSLSGGSINCVLDENLIDSCDYLNKTISVIFERTFESWQRSYFFEITKSFPGQELVEMINLNDGKGCLVGGDLSYQGMRWHDIDTNAYWIPLDPGTIQVKLGLCSNLY